MPLQAISSWQITKEAFQYVWHHKRLLGCLLILPLICWSGYIWVSLVKESLASYFSYKHRDIKLLFLALTILVNALSMKTWMQYVLNPFKKLTLKSYFTFNTYCFLYVAYTCLLLWVTYYFTDLIYGYSSILFFSIIKFEISIIIALAFILPLTLILPALANEKSFSIWATLKPTLASYHKFVLSISIGIIIAVLSMVSLYHLLNGMLWIAEQIFPSFLISRIIGFGMWHLFLLGGFFLYLLELVPLTIITVYYKKAVLKA